MKKKTIKATVSAVSIATAFAGISVVQADEVTATQPNESTLSTGSTTPSSTNIKQVNGVFVHNGVATVTKTPTSEVVEEARTIKEETDQSVSNQESALENAKASEATAATKVSEANVDLKNAEENKLSATPEKIEKTKNEISEVKTDIEKKETSLKDTSDKVLVAEKERNQLSEVIKKDRSVVISSFTIDTPRGVGTLFIRNICLVIPLSIARALLKYPVPVYLIPIRSNVACTFPSSPFAP